MARVAGVGIAAWISATGVSEFQACQVSRGGEKRAVKQSSESTSGKYVWCCSRE
jgi:hypothetical protein